MDVILNSPGCCWENANGDCLASWVYALPFTWYLFPVNKKLAMPGGNHPHPIVHGGMPSNWKCATSPTQKYSLLSNGMIAADSATSTQIDRSWSSGSLCSQCDASRIASMDILC